MTTLPVETLAERRAFGELGHQELGASFTEMTHDQTALHPRRRGEPAHDRRGVPFAALDDFRSATR